MDIDCRYLRRGVCTLNRTDEVSEEFCQSCQDRRQARITGLGDVVAATINITPIRRLKKKGCGCKKRQAALNKVVKFGKEGRNKNQSG